MEYTVEEVGSALGASEWSVRQWCRLSIELRKRGETGRFPHAYLRFESKKLGYRIPESDVLAYAETQSANVLERARQHLATTDKRELA